MTGGDRRDDADLLIIDAPDPADGGAAGSGPTGTRQQSRGGAPQSSGLRLGPRHGAGIAAGALAALVIAISVGGFALAPEPTSSPDPSGLQASGESIDPNATADVSCQAPPRGQFPPVTMSSTNSRRVISGLFAFGSGLGTTEGARGWKVPDLAAAARPEVGSRLEFRAGGQACFRHLLIEYIATATAPGGPVTVWLDATRPAVRTVAVDLLPEGDWVVRVTAEFDKVESSPAASVVTVTDFRVIVGNGPIVTDPAPTGSSTRPDRTPAVPCGSAIPTADIGVDLVVSNGPITPGSPSGGSLAADVLIRPGDAMRVIIEGETCATGWDVTLFDISLGEGMLFDSYRGKTDDPTIGAQNRWTVPATSSEAILTANLYFPGGLEIARYWRITVDQFVPPPLFLFGSDGTRFEASPGCGLSVHLSNDYNYSDDCATSGYVETPDALRIGALSVVHLDIPGWSIIQWSASCGHMSPDGLNFESPDGCSLGGGASEDGAPLPRSPAFFLRKGDQVVLIGVAAIDNAGNSFNVTYYAHVIAR